MANSRLGWIVLTGGIAASALGVWLVVRDRKQQKMLGAPTNVPETPVVGVTRSGGMTLEHRRSRRMSIDERVGNIQKMVWKSVNDPTMVKLAREITYTAPERDGEAEAKLIYNAVKARIRYTGDVAPVMLPDGSVEAVDLYQSAARTWEFRGGDCDDHSILVATLLSLNGITARLRVTKSRQGEDWSHIYVVAALPKFAPTKLIALDTTLPGRRFAYEVPYVQARDFPV
jgi:transglutaminase-like putative cysteine protease